MLDRIGRILKERFPEHLGGYMQGWLEVGSYVTKKQQKITTVSSSGQQLFAIIEFETDRRRIIQVFHKGKIIETAIL